MELIIVPYDEDSFALNDSAAPDKDKSIFTIFEQI